MGRDLHQDVGLLALPRELLALVVGSLEPIEGVRLLELTCRRLRSEADLASLWLHLSLDAGLPTLDGAGAALGLCALRRGYSRHAFHQRGACARCGLRARGRTQSAVDSAPLDSGHTHLCNWLVPVATARERS